MDASLDSPVSLAAPTSDQSPRLCLCLWNACLHGLLVFLPPRLPTTSPQNPQLRCCQSTAHICLCSSGLHAPQMHLFLQGPPCPATSRSHCCVGPALDHWVPSRLPGLQLDGYSRPPQFPNAPEATSPPSSGLRFTGTSSGNSSNFPGVSWAFPLLFPRTHGPTPRTVHYPGFQTPKSSGKIKTSRKTHSAQNLTRPDTRLII